MRVLHFFKTYQPDGYGGVEQVIYQLAEGGSVYGIEAEVLTLSLEPFPQTISVGHHRVHRVKRHIKVASTDFSFSVFPLFARLASQVDIVHYHFPWPVADLAHFLMRIKKPTIMTYHSDIVAQKKLLPFYQPLQNMFLSKVDKIVATSPNYVQSSPILARYQDKVTVIPLGLDRKSYPEPKPERLAYWRKQVGGKFFLFIGAFRYYKGLSFLIDAVKEENWPIALVGTGPMEAELRQKATRENMTHIHFLGALPDEDKIALLSLCHALVFPSHKRSEAFGLSLVEGAMFSKPLISCEIGTGTSYVNLDGETGFVIPPEDPVALRQAMKTLWDEPKLAARLGLQAQHRYEELFMADKMVRSYEKLYKELLW